MSSETLSSSSGVVPTDPVPTDPVPAGLVPAGLVRTRVQRRVGRVLRGAAVEGAQPAELAVDLDAARRSGEPSPSVAEQLEGARRQAFDEGFQAGMEAARQSAEAAKEEAVRRGAEALRQAAAAMAAGRANAIAVAEQDATALAIELTRTLVDHELSVSDDEVSATVRRALSLTSPGEQLVVRLHPDELVDAVVLAPLVPDCTVTVVADAHVERGGCVVDAGPCRIDAQIEPALDRVRSVLASRAATAADGGHATAEGGHAAADVDLAAVGAGPDASGGPA